MKLRVFLLLALIFCSSSWAQRTLTLSGRLRDFTPDGEHRCADFQHAIDGVVTGLVQNTLSGDEKPVRSAKQTSSLPSSGGCFGSWFRDDSNFNLAFPHDITLTETAVNSGIFRIEERTFFPLDNRGFGNYYNNRNYHFTFEVGARFTYQAGQVFRFSGDDDVWVFIDGRLAVDIGGVHGRADGQVNLDSFGLTVGQTYRFNFFFAERHTVESNFIMETSIELVSDNPDPPTRNPINFCGVELADHCAITGDCPRSLPTFKTTSPAPRQASFFEYNAVSFGDFNGPNAAGAVGDTEGRVAAAGSVTVPSGYSIGDKVITTGALAFLTSQTYALISAGGPANWVGGGDQPGGSVEPFGPGVNANPSPKEFVYADTTSRLPPLATILPQPSGHSFANDFAYGRSFYVQVANEFAALPSNANFQVQFSTLTITCQNNLATSYVVNIPATAFNTNGNNQVTSWALSGCNNNAQIIVNILGTEDVNFGSGDYLRFDGMLTGTPEQIDAKHRNVRILYNFGTANRNVNVGTLYGHMLLPNGNLNAGSGVIWGLVIAGRISASHQINLPRCPIPENPEEPPRPKCPFYETSLDSECLSLFIDDQTFSFSDFNLISFGSFNAETGDIQGRAIVRNNFNVGNGYSVGDQLNTSPSGRDRPLPFSLIAGGNVNWGSGSLYPRNEGLGDQEYMFVGGAFTGPTYLSDLIRPSVGLSSSLNSQLNRAQACYAGLQNSLAGKTPNVNFFEQYSGIFISCPNTANEYVMEIDGEVVSRATWYALDASCDPLNRWVINVVGSTPVTFNGNHLPGVSGGMIWNILGSGRLINVNTQVQGTILAPNGILNQRGGFIAGNVIVGDVSFVLQINVPECPPFVNPITIYTFTSDPVTPGQFLINTYSTPPANQNQQVQIGNEVLYIQGVGNNQLSLNAPVQNSYPPNTPVTLQITDPYAQYSGNKAGAVTGAALKVEVAVALMAALLALVALF